MFPVEEPELGVVFHLNEAQNSPILVKTRQSSGYLLAAYLLARRNIGYYFPTFIELSVEYFGPVPRKRGSLTQPGFQPREKPPPSEAP
jgi:hypothetical protein